MMSNDDGDELRQRRLAQNTSRTRRRNLARNRPAGADRKTAAKSKQTSRRGGR
jgi:hypothetical protein